ncbi:MAG TPA: hypothetical protein PLQ93_12715 [Bacteroidia bacterium]|nr:hypothetical protein [Bacteroidia bacterium]
MKSKLLFVFLFTLTVFVITLSCTKKVAVMSACQQNCDTITYAKDIVPIVSKECYPCHSGSSPTGGILLDSYDLFKTQAVNGRIKARAIDGNPSFMPQGGQLKQEQKCIIECWLNNGYKP